MPTLTREQIQSRNNAFVKDLRIALQSENQTTLKEVLTTLADKHTINFSNAQMLYYTKLKPELDGQENKAQPENEVETLVLNSKEVRIISHDNKEFLVARELLKSIGINSHSTLLYNMLDEDNRLLAPVKSSHGFAQTLIISKEIAKIFLEKASKEHQSVTIRKHAVKSLADFNAYLAKEKNTNVAELVEPKAEHEKLKELYENDKEVDFRIYRVTANAVYGEMKDVYRTPAVLLVEDIEGAMIGDLSRFFNKKKQEIISATVKHFDVEKNRVFLTYSLSSQAEAEQEVKEENPSSISISVKEKNENTHEFTVFSQEEQTKEEQIVAPLQEENGQAVLSIETEKEYEAIISLINAEARLGALSTAAKQELIQLLNEKGLVSVSSKVNATASNFQPDLGVLFVRALAEQVKKVRL